MGPAVAVLVFIMFGLVVWKTRDNGLPASPEPPLSHLVAEFRNVEAPHESRPATDMEATEKPGSKMVSGRFILGPSAEAGRQTFRSRLSQQGWSSHGTLGSTTHWVDVYCKQSLQASVELTHDTPPPAVVALSITWNQISVKECQ